MRRILLVLALALVGCPKPQPSPVVVDAADGAACTAGADVCAYCTHMRQLGCPEGQPTALGASCETVTANVRSSGIITMDLVCRTRASCDGQAACQ